MRTLSFFAALLLLSVLLCFSNQVFLGSAVPTILYVLAVCGLAALYAAEEKKKRVRLIERLNALFEGGETDLTADMVKAEQVVAVQVRPLAVLMVATERLADLYFYIRRET